MTETLNTPARIDNSMVKIVTETREEVLGFELRAKWTTVFNSDGTYKGTEVEVRNDEGYRVGRRDAGALKDCPKSVQDNVKDFAKNMTDNTKNL
ncbi:hypothetical protein M1M34_gp053 [Haloarcula tailed virus 2]|uniref:Uncharacterized protein n=1 Tax=Haloarcula tailed virus 2 TaxID=2877989 RepID=A0AAE8XZX0_9CAUD|nr:hypothetical protein M1M34_gp053 [Haloarcula tailed virus 2]UBF23204.1 hypothetical protein HATV-2_gp53 [Haloarcula tailed virus 2]